MLAMIKFENITSLEQLATWNKLAINLLKHLEVSVHMVIKHKGKIKSLKRQKLGETRKRGKPKENHLHNGFLPKKKNQQELRKILISKTSSAKKVSYFKVKDISP